MAPPPQSPIAFAAVVALFLLAATFFCGVSSLVPPFAVGLAAETVPLSTALARSTCASDSNDRLRLPTIVGQDRNETACARALASTPVRFVESSRVSSQARLWARLAPCMDALVGSVFVYELPGINLFPDSGAPLTPWLEKWDQYSADMYIVHLLKQSDLYTDDPSRASLFLVPNYATHETHYCAFNEHNSTRGKDITECSATLERGMLRDIMHAMEASPWYTRFNGADHMMVFPWDWGFWLFSRNNLTFEHWVKDSSMLLLQYQPVPVNSMTNAAIRTVVMLASYPRTT